MPQPIVYLFPGYCDRASNSSLHGTSQDNKNHATYNNKKNSRNLSGQQQKLCIILGQKKSCNLLGQKKFMQPLGPKKITQPLGTKNVLKIQILVTQKNTGDWHRSPSSCFFFKLLLKIDILGILCSCLCLYMYVCLSDFPD